MGQMEGHDWFIKFNCWGGNDNSNDMKCMKVDSFL